MAKGTVENFLNQNKVARKITIFKGTQEITINNRSIISVQIFEDLFNDCTCTLKFIDEKYLSETIPIIGGEKISIKFARGLTTFEYTFLVTNIQGESAVSDNKSPTTVNILILELILIDDFILNNSYNYTGVTNFRDENYEITKIIDNLISGSTNREMDKKIKINYKTLEGVTLDGLLNFSPIHNWSIRKTINFFLLYCNTKKGNAGYILHFDRVDNNHKIVSYSEMNTNIEDIQKEDIYVFNNDTTGDNKVLNFRNIKNPNFDGLVSLGIIKSKYMTPNIKTKTISSEVFNIEDYFKVTENKAVMSTISKKYIKNVKSKEILKVKVFSGLDANTNLYNNTTKLALLESSIIELYVEGKSSNYIGKPILFIKYSSVSSKGINEIISGVYIITAINNILEDDLFFQKLELNRHWVQKGEFMKAEDVL